HLDQTAVPVKEHQASRRGPPETRLQEMVPELHRAPRHLPFDAAGGDHRQCQTVAAERVPLPGYVQHPEDLAMNRIADHRRRTGPWLDSRAEVFGAVHL